MSLVCVYPNDEIKIYFIKFIMVPFIVTPYQLHIANYKNNVFLIQSFNEFCDYLLLILVIYFLVIVMG